MHPRFRTFVSALLLATAGAAVARAGQVRVNLSGFAFSPTDVTVNQGDHVVWVWTSSNHTVTSGDRTQVADEMIGDGRFNTSPDGTTYNLMDAYSWKSDFTGTQIYYCQPHSGMIGTITMLGSGATGTSDFRVTEVLYNTASGGGLVEITNLGAAGNLGMYRLQWSGGAAQTLKKAGATGASTNLLVAAGGRVIVHVNAAGTTTDTDVYLSGSGDLPAAGSLALFVPNTVQPSLADPKQMIDFVQWGAGGQANEAAAVTAGFWFAGAAVPAVAAGHSLEWCGQPGQYGSNRWYDNPTPNVGAVDNCVVPALRTTWGRIKSLYR